MALPHVVILGRPNVGKSSVLNALARRRISIVDARAGVTRDRVSAVIEHNDCYFELIDTGGVGIVDDDQLEEHVDEQIQYAIARADACIFLVDVKHGITPLDRRVAELLRRLDKPVLLAANKVDSERHETEAAEFIRLGYGEPLCLSALHGRGRNALLDRIAAVLAMLPTPPPEAPLMRLAIVGKRNAGKSTLVNALAREQRVIVSETPGTTRDAIDVHFEKDGRAFVAIDTAGVRKRKSMDDIDFYSYTRALHSIRSADVVMHMVDASVPISDVDAKLASAVLVEEKPIVLAVNKWDLVKGRATPADYDDYLARVIPALDYAPVAIVTAETGKNVDAAIDLALSLHQQARTRVGTGRLNAVLKSVLEERGPSAKRGTRRVKIYYATQVATEPPTIVFFCNDPGSVTDNYRRFMRNRLRELLPFHEIPMRLLFRARREQDDRTPQRAMNESE